MSDLSEEIQHIPCIDSHEHIGYISSMPHSPDGWRSDSDSYPGCEPGTTTLFDIVFSSFLGAHLHTVGYRPPQYQCGFHELPDDEQERLWTGLLPYLNASRGTGLYLSLNQAFSDLYQVSLDELVVGEADWRAVSDAIRRSYGRGLFQWTRTVFDQANIQYAIKPVQVSYLALLGQRESDKAYALERQVFQPILRVEDLMGWESADSPCSWEHAERALGLRVRELGDLEQMVEKAFALIAQHSVRAIKQAQAYLRTLRFEPVERDAAQSALKRLREEKDAGARLVVQDYIMGLVLEQAQWRKLPFQVHTGVTNLPHSSPELLTPIISRYPNVEFILLHCYPYCSEAAFLARTYRNVYLDSAWIGLLSPTLLSRALAEWIGYAPYPKICLSGDATSVEECYGAMSVTRRVLALVLSDKITRGELDRELALDISRSLLAGNASRLYGGASAGGGR